MRGRQSTDEPAVAKQPPDSRLLGAKQTAACNSRLNSASLFSATSHMCNSRLIRRLSSGVLWLIWLIGGLSGLI